MDERVGKRLSPQGNDVKSRGFEDGQLLKKGSDVDSEIADLFPALQKYKNEHNTANLQKLMVEILEFCHSVYASTKNENERNVYRSMIKKINIF